MVNNYIYDIIINNYIFKIKNYIFKIKSVLGRIKMYIWIKNIQSNKKGVWYYSYYIIGGYKND